MRYEDDYYILDQEDHNFYASTEELNQCKNDLIDTKRIKFQRDVLLKDVYNYYTNSESKNEKRRM